MLGSVAAVPCRQALDGSLNHIADSPPSFPVWGSRLCLRSLNREDLDERQDWPPFNDPLHLIWDMPYFSQQQNDRWFARLSDRRHYLAYAVDNHTGLLIGMISLRDISWASSARLGIAFRSTHVGQGYGTEALSLFLSYFFRTLNFHRIILDVAAGNLRAVRCYRKLGFRQVRSFWRAVDGPLDLDLLDRAEHSQLCPFFRKRWKRVETLYRDMELRRQDWDGELAIRPARRCSGDGGTSSHPTAGPIDANSSRSRGY